MPKVSQGHLDARREQILLAAHRCFGRKGFHGTTMRDICEEAELSTGAVYRYFDGKGAIVESLAKIGFENSQTLLRESAPDASAGEAVIERLEGLIGAIDSPRGIESARIDVRLRGEAMDTPVLRDLLLSAYRGWTDVFAGIIEEGQSSGEINPGIEPRAAGRLFVALMTGAQLQAAIETDVGAAEMMDACRTLLTGGLTRPSKDHPDDSHTHDQAG